ncbi:MAG TPA: DUF2059 domain-containing protein [Roseiarcus sp.]
MSSFPSILKASLGAIALFALAGASAGAEDAQPSPAAIGYASKLFVDIGMKSSLDQVVPALLAELERTITTTRPELKEPLHQTLVAIEPDFAKTEGAVLTDSAKALASSMTEEELKETVAFFEGPAGKKFLAVQPVVLGQVGQLARAWREKISNDMLARSRAEMKQKGYSF